MMDELPDNLRQLILNAVTTYGDACSLPTKRSWPAP
jgi:hypothetical protein